MNPFFVRAYLRASTKEQDANRARAPLEVFAKEHGLDVASWYCENESGAKLERPELFRLLNDCKPGDVLLVEQVDRLSRLSDADWAKLKGEIKMRGVRIVALDLPTSWECLKDGDSFTKAMLAAVNGMLLDMLAAIARKDYTDRRRRQSEGIEKAKAEGKFKGRRTDEKRHAVIAGMLSKGMSWTDIQTATSASRSTIKRVNDAQKKAHAMSDVPASAK